MLFAVITLSLPAAVLADSKHGLPPGLQKNMEAGKPLPPGWEKKLHRGDILERDLYQRGVVVIPVDSRGVVTVRIEDQTLRLVAATLEIVDILTH